jgi:hypothetical protein
MPNTTQKHNSLGVFIDDVWLSGVQSFERSHSIESNSPSDTGRIQSTNVFINAGGDINISLSRVIGDIAPFFYQPASLSSYDSTFLLANTNIGLSGWDVLKEYKVQLVWGDDNDAYLGANAANYVSLDTFEYCLLSGLSYSISNQGVVIETVTLTTRNQTTTHDSLLSALSLPSFPELIAPIKSEHIDLISSVFPSVIDTVFDNGWNALNGRDSEHGKYALTAIELSLEIEYSDFTDTGRPRGSVTPSTQNKWRYIANTNVTCSISGLARQSDFDKAVTDQNFSTYPSPDYQLKIVALLGSNYHVWDLGSKNFITSYEAPAGNTPDGQAEFSMTFTNRRHDFVPYINSSILTLTQSGTY